MKIWRVIYSNGVIQHFPSETEARFAAKDAKNIGIGSMTHEIPWPASPTEFADFCDRMLGVFREYGNR